MKRIILLIALLSWNAQALTVNPKIDGLIQIWGIYNNPAANSQSNNAENEFRRGVLVRRTQVKLQEERSESLRWEIKFDLARNFHDGANQTTTERTKTLLDMFVDYKLLDNLELRVGQFKEPTASEGLVSSGELFFAERSYVGRFFGNGRDIGVQLTHTQGMIQTQLAVFNGDGVNQPTGSSMRELIGNISYSKEGSRFGIWVNQKAENEKDKTDPEDAALGFYGNIPLGKLTLKAEFATQSKNDKAQGQYIMAKYQLNDRDSIKLRLDTMQDRPKDNELTAIDFGFERLFEKEVSFKSDLRMGSEKSTGEKRDIHELIMQLQVKF